MLRCPLPLFLLIRPGRDGKGLWVLKKFCTAKRQKKTGQLNLLGLVIPYSEENQKPLLLFLRAASLFCFRFRLGLT